MNPPPEIQIADRIALPHAPPPPAMTGTRETVFPLVNPSTYAPARSNITAGMNERRSWKGGRRDRKWARGYIIHGVGRNQDGVVERIKAVMVDPPPVYQYCSVFSLSHPLGLHHRHEKTLSKREGRVDIQAITRYPNRSCRYPLPFPLPLVRADQTTATLTACKTGNLANGK